VNAFPIGRPTEAGAVPGVAIPVFIRNVQHHFTTVDAYSDGAINAWGFLDRPLFRAKVRTGWVATAPPAGATLSAYDLGSATVAEGTWPLTPDDILDRVEEAIRELNPEGRDLLDMQGSNIELRGNVKYAKLGYTFKRPYVPGNIMLFGERTLIFRRTAKGFLLDNWFVFNDGSSRIGTTEPLVDLQDVMLRTFSGELSTTVPDGALIELGDLGSFRVGGGRWLVDMAERRREMLDLLAQTRGSPSSRQVCGDAFKSFLQAPTEENRERLRTAYEAVPAHLRRLLGGMSEKDSRIRKAVYGDEGESLG